MAEEGRLSAWQADGVVPVTSHILLSLPGSERASFPRLAREGGWQANRIRSEVTRCSLAGTADRQTFSTARAALFLRDGPPSHSWGAAGRSNNDQIIDFSVHSESTNIRGRRNHLIVLKTKPMGGVGGGLAPPVSCSGYCRRQLQLWPPPPSALTGSVLRIHFWKPSVSFPARHETDAHRFVYV